MATEGIGDVVGDATSPTERELDAYAARLGWSRPLAPNLRTLRAIHRAHLEAIPFENSSVLFGESIAIDPAAFVRKIGIEGRGGFCYELNGAFGALLSDAGFEVEHLEGRVHTDGRLDGPRFDHLALRVTLEAPWLVDVGFGHFFAHPLRLVPALEQDDPMGAFRVVDAEDGIDVEWRHRDGRWVAHYRVDRVARQLADFGPTCRLQQTSPSSPFRDGWICSRLSGPGGVSLFGSHVVDTTSGERIERDLSSDDEIVEIARVAVRNPGEAPGRAVDSRGSRLIGDAGSESPPGRVDPITPTRGRRHGVRSGKRPLLYSAGALPATVTAEPCPT